MWRNKLVGILLLLAGLWSAPSVAAVATIYIDTGGCQTGSTTRCSGTTDSATASAGGAAAVTTCSATSGPAAAPGCTITGAAGQLGAIAVDGSQALFLNGATNSNQKIFFINSIDDGTGSVGTTVTPTGLTAAATDWGIGGRMIYASANIEAALRAGDTVLFNNSPAAKTTTFFTSRTAGDSTSGYINLTGKAGVRPVLTISSGTANVLSLVQSFWHIENLELKQQGTVADVISTTGNANLFVNLKISQGAANGIGGIVSGNRIVNCEITGLGAAGITQNAVNNRDMQIIGNYIHNNTTDGIVLSAGATATMMINNVVSNNGGRGINISAATGTGDILPHLIYGNTIYGNGNSGLEVADTDTLTVVVNNIFQENGNAAGEYNVEWVAGTAELLGYHANNLFFHSNCQGSGTGGPACVLGLTVNSTESSSNALFTNAGAADFTLQLTSPAKATGYPGVLLGGSTGYLDMGALQRLEPTAGGGKCIGC